MSLAKTLRALLDAGFTAEQLVAVAEAQEAASEVKQSEIDRRRSLDAARQASKRARERDNHVKSRDVTEVTPRARVVNSSSSLRSEGKKELTTFVPKSDEKPKAVKPHCLPADWQPSEETRQYGLKLGRTATQVLSDWEEMRLWALGNGGSNTLKKDWDMALKGWMRRNHEKQGAQPRAGPFPQSTGGFANIAAMRMREDERDFDDQIRNAGPPAEPIDIRSREPLFERAEGDQFSKMAHRGGPRAFGG